eukprot:1157965-Pelagomonas_calceolata.AAC.5
MHGASHTCIVGHTLASCTILILEQTSLDAHSSEIVMRIPEERPESMASPFQVKHQQSTVPATSVPHHARTSSMVLSRPSSHALTNFCKPCKPSPCAHILHGRVEGQAPQCQHGAVAIHACMPVHL